MDNSTRLGERERILHRRMFEELVPLGDRVLVKPDDAPEKQGMIFVPSAGQIKPTRGTVIAVGAGRYENGQLVAVGVEEGERIIYSKFAGAEIESNGEKLLCLRESDIMFVIKE